MLSPVDTLLVGALFGLALAAPPGPMNAIIAEESVLRGWTAGFRAGLGAMSADVLFFVLAAFGALAVVDHYPSIRTVCYLVGGVLMLYFAVGALADARRSTAFREDVSTDSTGFRRTFALSLTNPYQIGFWLTAGIALLEPGTIDVAAYVPAVGGASDAELVVRTGSPVLLLGFFAGIAVWAVTYPAALVRAGRRIDAIAPLVAGLSAAVLAVFGVVFLGLGVGSL
ncbi:LysE family translocator [Halobacteria archaeon AArc-dxtr1]|nr:LysE family translocator [Halobacteria archaeon AArc-dxtr1]